MPYTAAQLTAYYTALTGTAPDQFTQNNFNSFATQNANGTLSDQATLATVFNAVQVQATFEVIESTYQFFTGSGVSQAGLAFLRGDANSGNANGLNSAYYANFNLENRYYNFAINLASTGGAGNANFVGAYGGLTFQQTVQSAYEAIVGTASVGQAQAAAAIADITSRQGFFTQIAQQRAGGVDAGGAAGQNIALKAIVVGYILEEANKADVGTYAKAIDQLEASVAAGNAIFSSNILTTYGPNGAGFGTGVGQTGQTGTTGQFFALTPGTDTFNSPAGNATFVGAIDNTPANSGNTLNPSDVINAQGANNTLIVNVTGGTADATNGAILNGIATVDVRSTDGAAAVLNQQQVAGATNLNSYLSTGTVTFNNVNGSSSVGVIGNGSVQGGSLVANYVSGTTANVLVQNGTQSNAANGAGTATNVTINSANGAAATVNVRSTGTPNFIDNLNLAANTTTATVTADQGLTINATTAAALATLNVTGSGAVNLGGTALSNTVRTVTAGNGGLTAVFTAPAAAAAGLSVTTGTGADNITVNGTLTATSNINTSGGGDSITINGPITAGATINGGGGATLGTTSAVYLGATQGAGAFSAANIAKISGFSTLSIIDALTTGSTYDVNLIGAQNFRTVGVAAGGTAQLFAAPGATVTFTNAINTNTGNLSIQEAGAQSAAQTNDVLNLVATGQANNNTLNVTVPVSAAGLGIETVNITANRSAAAVAAAAQPVLTVQLNDSAAKALTFAGNERFIFTADNTFTSLTSVVSTSTANATINVAAITNSGVGGVSNGTTANPFVVTTGTGVDTITVQDFARVTAGAGADLVNAVTATNGQSYSTFADATANDRVFLTGATQTVAAANVAAKITLNSTAVFQDYLDAATSGARAIGEVSSFDFAGNTFLVVNNNGAVTFQNGSDGIIQLAGVHTVGSIAAGVVTLGS